MSDLKLDEFQPTPEEIAERMDLPLDKVRKILKIAREPISLETPIGEEEDSHLGDFIEDAEALALSGRKDESQAALWVAYQWSGSREKSIAFYTDRADRERTTRPALADMYGTVLACCGQGAWSPGLTRREPRICGSDWVRRHRRPNPARS